jgi:hypothetical protein
MSLLPPLAQMCIMVSAERQLLPEAGAERTLEAVSCTPWFGLAILYGQCLVTPVKFQTTAKVS